MWTLKPEPLRRVYWKHMTHEKGKTLQTWHVLWYVITFFLSFFLDWNGRTSFVDVTIYLMHIFRLNQILRGHTPLDELISTLSVRNSWPHLKKLLLRCEARFGNPTPLKLKEEISCFLKKCRSKEGSQRKAIYYVVMYRNFNWAHIRKESAVKGRSDSSAIEKENIWYILTG